ncbi:hypothetical protein MTO96_018452 [Rhipicephalus appendiculatus]
MDKRGRARYEEASVDPRSPSKLPFEGTESRPPTALAVPRRPTQIPKNEHGHISRRFPEQVPTDIEGRKRMAVNTSTTTKAFSRKWLFSRFESSRRPYLIKPTSLDKLRVL